MTQRDWLTRKQVARCAEAFSSTEAFWGKEIAEERNKKLDALCSMALAALDADWQPIETAPKDGTAILVYTGGTDITTAQWRHDSWNLVEWGAFADDALCHPTHWRPLPPPPRQKERPE